MGQGRLIKEVALELYLARVRMKIHASCVPEGALGGNFGSFSVVSASGDHHF